MTARAHVRPSPAAATRGLLLAVVATLSVVVSVLAGAGPARAQTPELDVQLGGWAANSAVLPDGDVLVSNLTGGMVQRIDAGTRRVSTVVSLPSPGGLAVRGDTLYAVVGNTPASVLSRQGGVVAVDLVTGARRTVLSGLGEANGLELLPGGDLVLTVTLGAGTGVHRLDPATGRSRLLTTSVPSPNGLAVGAVGEVYVG